MPDETAPLPALSVYEKLRQRRGLMQFLKFGVVGLSGFAVNLVIFTLLQKVVAHHDQGLQYYSIYSISFLAGGVSNYTLNRNWTFRSDAHAGKEGAQFITVSVIALLFSFLISYIANPYLGHGHRLWFVATCGAIVVNFIINKYWTFRGR